MEREEVIVVIKKGFVQEVYSDNTNLVVKVVDLDLRKLGEEYIYEFTSPKTQSDLDKITEHKN
ncbi:MAG: hypothetical protein M5R37_09710 [Melioribacteraceae bacterium]|nr:hypothetical protein [Melioribacteraceae bacterium]